MRLRATVAATLVVALALGVAALVLITALRGTLESSADAAAARKVSAVLPYADTIELYSAEAPPGGIFERTTEPTDGPADERASGRAGARTEEPTSGRTDERTDERTEEPLSPPARTQPAEAGMTAPIRVYQAYPKDGTVARIADPDVLLTKQADAAKGWAKPGQYAVARAQVATAAGPAVVLGRASLEGAEEALNTLYGALLPGVPALLLVVAGMTWFSVGRALGPVAAIRAKVADITARDLHQRVPVPSSKDEIAALATTVNGTLDRLETAVERHKRFVADAAHELRSPIATLRARLELAESSELTVEALADVERLQSLAADLLMLAKLDAGEPLRAAELDLGQVAAEASLRARRRPEVRVELDVEPDVVMRGSSAHLDRLVTNLADNAVRHAASTVRVRVAAEAGQAVLEVCDDGPGIPPEHREAVFDRFTRLDEARARDAGGAGLGLPIARDIALLHEGSLVYAGSGFVARFPLYDG